MTGIANGKGTARYAANHGHTRSGSSELCDTQTANTPKQSQGHAPLSSSIGAEREMNITASKLERRPEQLHTVDGATAARSDMDNQTLSAKTQRLCRVTNDILSAMEKVEEAMVQLKQYIQSEKNSNKPLYKWTKFDGYRTVSRTIGDLDKVAAKLETVHLPRTQVKTYLSRATRISLSVSQIAVFAMGVMSDKSAKCLNEIEDSSPSAESKDSAVTSELKKLLKHCTRATDRVYAALDLLRKSLIIEESYHSADVTLFEELIAEREARQSSSRTSWLWKAAGIILGAMTSAAIALTTARFFGNSSCNLGNLNSNSNLHTQVMNLISRTQSITNLTGEAYTTQLEDLGQRYKDLADASESHGLRIDNLVEALGIPNEQGTYFSSMHQDSTPLMDCRVPEDIREYMHKFSRNADRQLERLNSEMELMRKNVHRMDIRLTKRLNKVDRYGR